MHTDQLTQLRQEAKEKRISLNTLAYQIFDTYVNYASNAAKAGMIPISKEVIVELLEGYNDEQLEVIAERVQKKISKEAALLLRGEYSFEALVDTYEYWLQIGGFPYTHFIEGNNNKRHTFVARFDMGRKFSAFQAELLKAYFEPFVTKGIESTITDNSVAITVEGEDGGGAV
jgi:hypothetical protein